MKIYCITHKPNNHISYLGLIPFGVGLSDFPRDYVVEKKGINIANKNNHYSETSFHYWYWKNILNSKPKNEWFGMCQYRRYFVKYEYNDLVKYSDGYQGFYPNIKKISDLKEMLQLDIPNEWNDFDAILCKPWSVVVKSKTKLIKRGFKSLLKDPSIFFSEKKQNIRLHFEMFHGHNNLQKAINLGLKPCVVINKVDKENCTPEEVHEAVFDLMFELGAEEWQLDFPTVYGSAKFNWMSLDWANKTDSIAPLLDMVIDHIPSPKIEDGITQMLITSLDYSSFTGRIAIGRLQRGSLDNNQSVALVKRDGSILKSKIKELHIFEGLGRKKVSKIIISYITKY